MRESDWSSDVCSSDLKVNMSCNGTDMSRLEAFLALVEKPSRYTGGEANAAVKDRSACRLHVALAFPDAYEVGMSHLGLQILYAILNAHPHICAERVYAPWPDMEARLRAGGLRLSTLESGTPLAAFDLIGVSLQYELSYTNVLTLLDLGGVPLRAKDRRDGDPVVIAGGPCAFNPLPMAPFFDALVIGEGEEVVSEIAEVFLRAKEKGLRRAEVLERLAALGPLRPVPARGGEAGAQARDRRPQPVAPASQTRRAAHEHDPRPHLPGDRPRVHGDAGSARRGWSGDRCGSETPRRCSRWPTRPSGRRGTTRSRCCRSAPATTRRSSRCWAS
jgi:hypothetical protein